MHRLWGTLSSAGVTSVALFLTLWPVIFALQSGVRFWSHKLVHLLDNAGLFDEPFDVYCAARVKLRLLYCIVSAGLLAWRCLPQFLHLESLSLSLLQLRKHLKH